MSETSHDADPNLPDRDLRGTVIRQRVILAARSGEWYRNQTRHRVCRDFFRSALHRRPETHSDPACAKLLCRFARRVARPFQVALAYQDADRQFPCARRRPWAHPTDADVTRSSRDDWLSCREDEPCPSQGKSELHPQPLVLSRARRRCHLSVCDPCSQTIAKSRDK